METPETLLEFPCDFPIKAAGEAREGFSAAVIETVLLYAPDFDASTLETRTSSGGKYVSLTCTINATSKMQLDNLYRALSAHPMVKVVL
jgi:putative lipoic acid-binding regulatory protein